MLVAIVLPMAAGAQSYQSVPYTTGFEGLNTGDQPTGWVAYESVTTSLATFPCAYNYSGNARNGNVYYEFEFSSGSSQRTLTAATCEFADPSSLMVDFYASTTSSYAPTLFEVGVMEDSVFVPVDTVTLTNASSFSSSSYYHYRVYLVDYTGNGHRIAFRAYKSGSGQMTLFLDDMTITTAPSCSYMPGTPTATVDSGSATLTWANATVTAGYMLYLNNDSSWYYTSTNSYTFTDLVPNTQYSGYLYNNCTGSDTSEGVPFSFRTACGMTELPLAEGFEEGSSIPSCWNVLETYDYYGTVYPNVYSSYAHTGSRCLRMYGQGSQSVATPLIYANLNLLQFRFWARRTASYYNPQFAVGYTTTLSESSIVYVDTISPGDDYTEYLFQFEGAPASNGYIVLRKVSNDYGTIAFDDLEVGLAPTCMYMPGTPSVVALDSANATLRWTAATSGSYYALYLEQDSSWHTASDTTYTFTGLAANTFYNGRLYNICLSGDTSNCTYFDFRTSCGTTILPLVEDFDSYGGEFPSCWRITEMSGTYPSISTSAGRSGHGVYIYAYSNGVNCAFASPRIEQPINTVETKFWGRGTSTSYYTHTVMVGYVTNLDSAATSTVWVDTMTMTASWQEYTVSFAGLTTDDTGYVVYRRLGGNYGYTYIDDITIRQVSSCGVPQAFHSTGTAAGQMSLAWDDSVASSWQVVYGPTGFDPDTVVSNTLTVMADTVTVTGLDDNVTYDFYVRALCGGENSYWQGPVTARPNLHVMRQNQTDTVYMCGGTICDDGGLTGNYSYSQTSTLIVYPTDNTQTVTISGSYNTYSSSSSMYGELIIYEGVGTSGRVLGSFYGTDTFRVTSLEGAATIRFASSGYSGYYTSSGYELTVSCSELATCNAPYGVNVNDIAGSSALVSWDYGTSSTPQYFTVGVYDTASGAYTVYTVADTVRSLLLGGLNQTTTYFVSVRANCSAYDVSDSVGVYFTTKCYVGGEIQVGDGTVGLTSHPINTYYNYSICQVLYNNTEVAALADTIFGIKLYQTSGPNATRDITIYLDTTSTMALTGGSDFVVMDSSKIVYTGTPTFHNGWNEFVFTTPWVRPSTTNNIVLTFDDNTGSYSSTTTWQGTGDQSGNTLYNYGDGTNYDPTTPGVSINTTTNRPNVVFMAPCGDASCVPPNVTVGTTSANSVTLNWMAGLNELAWTVEYRLATDTVWSVATASTTALTFTVTGLYANTIYYFRVGSLCGTSTAYNQTYARTACAVMSRSSLPLSEDFEAYATGEVPNCWSAPLVGSSSSGNFPSCYNYSYNAHGGDVYFEMESSATQDEIFTLPAIDTIDGLEVSFYAAGYSYSAPSTFEIGVWEGDSAFVTLDTIDLDLSGYYVYHPYYYRIHYNGTGNQIAFHTTGSNYTVFLDDFRVYVPNPCDSVMNLVFDTIGMSRLSFSWTDTAARGSYTVKIGTSNNSAAALYTATTVGTSYTFTGLTGLTTYYVWVYANCGSLLSEPISATATTLGADPHYLPYYNDFEDSTNLFSVYQRSGSNGWHMGSAVNHGGTHSLYVSNDNGTTNAYTNSNQSISFAMTYLQIPYDSSYAISYDWRCQGEGSYDLMRVALVPEGYDFTSSFTSINRYSNTLPTGWIALDGGKRNLRNTWQHDNNAVRLSAGNYYLTLVWINDGAMGSNPPAAIDNIQFSLLTCPAPENLVATATSSRSISASWDAGAASSWIVEYGVSGFTPGMGTFVGVATNSVAITGLAPVTAYDIYVRPVCSATDTGFVASTTCLTGCDSLINDFPWVEDFENGIACWEQYHSRGTVDWTTGRGGNAYGGLSGAATGQYNARFTCNSYDGYTTYLITPMLNIPTEADVMMTFYHAQPAWGSDQDTLAVLYRTHPDSAWHYVASWNNSIPTWQIDTVMLPNATATYQVAFMAHSGFGQGVLLDSIVVYGTESCTRPTFANVNVGPTSIAATWVGPASSYDVAIKPANTNVWPAPTRVSAHSYTFTGLEPNTTYNYRVRSLCSDTSISYWTTSNSVTDTLTCYVPENVVVDEADFQTVTLSWRSDVTAHTVAYVVNVYNSAFSSHDTVFSNHVTIGGIYPGTSYNVRVQAMCSATTYSDWSEEVPFTTPSCQPVTDITVSQVTSSSALVQWRPAGEETAWVVSYGFHGFDYGTGTDITVTSPACTLTDLMDEMEYDVYVRAACTEEVLSDSYRVTFTTTSQTGIVPADGTFACHIHPNPASHAATVSVDGVSGRLLVSLVDMNGRVVASHELWCNGDADCHKQLLLDGLAQGAYYVHIVADNVNLVRKLVVR